MNLAELADRVPLRAFAAPGGLVRPVAGGYVTDLLSDVIAHGRKDDVWVTLQVHPNIVAVAVLKELAAVVLVNGREPAPETLEQAERQGVVLLGSPLSAFELVGRLHGLGVKGP
jgi:hypothetical protein